MVPVEGHVYNSFENKKTAVKILGDEISKDKIVAGEAIKINNAIS